MKGMLPVFLMLASFAATAQTNFALSLNGANQYVSIGAPVSSNSSYTKEAWVYTAINSGARNIISSLNTTFWIQNSTLYAGQAGSYTRVSDPSAFPLNRWVHVAVTYDAATTTMKLYRDGINVSTNSSVPAYTSENEFIGSHAGTGSYFQGSIDEVRIWNIALTQAQLKQNMYKGPADNASGLVAYYKCNNGSGAVLTNATGGTNGALQNSPSWVASPVQYAANALSCDGTNDVVTIADNNTLDITTAITLEAWVYATKNSGIQNVVCKSSSSSNNGYIFPRTDNGWTSVVLYFHISGGWRTLSAAYPSLNAWHHLAATYDGAAMKIYIDGVLSASQAQTGTITTNTNVLAIGNQTGISEYFGGNVDEVRIWNVARTQAQIQDNMYEELDPTTQTGLVSYFSFNQGSAAGSNTGLTALVDMSSTNNGTLNNFALSGSSSNFVTQNSSLEILPLQWLSFTARQQDGHVLLNWSTAAEHNTKDFIVQHSNNGISWTDIAVLTAAGNSNTTNNYSYTHPHPAEGINYYRILQKDIDGSSSYGETRSVRFAGGEAIFTVLNNPVNNGRLQIRLNRATFLSLYNCEGKLLQRRQFTAGIATIDLGNYAKGAYWLQANGHTKKVVVQ